MAMMAIMCVIVTHYPTIITRINLVIDVSQVVPRYLLGDLINPNFPSQSSVTTLLVPVATSWVSAVPVMPICVAVSALTSPDGWSVMSAVTEK